MGNIIKSFLDLSGNVANTQVADVYSPLVSLGSVGDTVVTTNTSSSSSDIANIIESISNSSQEVEEDNIYRVKGTSFKYIGNNGQVGIFFLSAGSKVVKIGQNNSWALVVIWKEGIYYKGLIPLNQLLRPVDSQHLFSIESFLNDAEHTFFRLKKRLDTENNPTAVAAFKSRIFTPLEQNITNFKKLFQKNPKQAELKLKSALVKYQPLMEIPPNQIDYPTIVQRHLDAIFSVNDFGFQGLAYSKQVLVLPFTEAWVLKYKDERFNEDEDIQEITGKMSGTSGEGTAVGYSDWEMAIAFLEYLIDITINNETAKNTLEGKWLLSKATLLNNNQIREIIFIHESTWKYKIKDRLATEIGLRDIHGPFYTAPLFTVIAHEINVNCDFFFMPGDTHALNSTIESTSFAVNTIKENLAMLENSDYESAFYLSNSYLSATSLLYIFKTI